jgi:hypothetical protein
LLGLPCSALLWLPFCAACQININGVPLVLDGNESDDDRLDGAVAPDDEELTPSDADVEHPDGSTTDGGEDAATRPVPGLPHHATCKWPNVETDRETVLVPTDARGRPSFDWWRDITCEETSDYETCTPDLNGRSRECDQCIRGDSSAASGLCIGPYGPDFCIEGTHSIAVELNPRGCLVCADPRLRQHACCNQIAGFDCRSWPYPGNSTVGGLCARHADCEAGLMCKTQVGWRFGTCTCPELTGPAYSECSPWTPTEAGGSARESNVDDS